MKETQGKAHVKTYREMLQEKTMHYEASQEVVICKLKGSIGDAYVMMTRRKQYLRFEVDRYMLCIVMLEHTTEGNPLPISYKL